jgi:hypothetical protein
MMIPDFGKTYNRLLDEYLVSGDPSSLRELLLNGENGENDEHGENDESDESEAIKIIQNEAAKIIQNAASLRLLRCQRDTQMTMNLLNIYCKVSSETHDSVGLAEKIFGPTQCVGPTTTFAYSCGQTSRVEKSYDAEPECYNDAIECYKLAVSLSLLPNLGHGTELVRKPHLGALCNLATLLYFKYDENIMCENYARALAVRFWKLAATNGHEQSLMNLASHSIAQHRTASKKNDT